MPMEDEPKKPKLAWEYSRIVHGGDLRNDHADDKLNEMGKEGWEAYHAEHAGGETIYFMKRNPIEPEPEKTS